MQINLDSILLWGFIATMVLSLVMAGSQQVGWSRMSLPFMVGSIFAARRSRIMVFGFLSHLVLGCAFALVYALVFESWGRAGAGLGALLGLFHGLFMLVVGMSVLPVVHPRMAGRHHGPTPTRLLEPPGFMASNYGWRTTLVTLLAHVLYGAVIGAFYELV